MESMGLGVICKPREFFCLQFSGYLSDIPVFKYGKRSGTLLWYSHARNRRHAGFAETFVVIGDLVPGGNVVDMGFDLLGHPLRAGGIRSVLHDGHSFPLCRRGAHGMADDTKSAAAHDAPMAKCSAHRHFDARWRHGLYRSTWYSASIRAAANFLPSRWVSRA